LNKRDLYFFDIEIDDSVKDEEIIMLDVNLRHPVHQKLVLLIEP